MIKMQFVFLLMLAITGVFCQTEVISYPNFVDALASTPELSSLLSAATIAGLDEALRNPDLEYTIFAPTNEAFNAALEDLGGLTIEELNLISSLNQILTYHIVNATVFAEDLEDGMELITLEGTPVYVNLTDGGVVIEGAGSSANVVQADIGAGEGVVHVIDGVLYPYKL